jgi:nucleotide-binding universal stress UspA family protein
VYYSIVIGVDGREGGRDAIALAKRLASPGASFTLAHVAARGPVSWWRHHMAEERVFDGEASMLDAERQSAAIPAGIVCVGGVPPARGLHDLARERGADLIVVGCSRHALIGRVLLGDDARASLDRAPCAVAIAPRGYAHSHPPLVDIGVGYKTSPEIYAVSTEQDDQLAPMR